MVRFRARPPTLLPADSTGALCVLCKISPWKLKNFHVSSDSCSLIVYALCSFLSKRLHRINQDKTFPGFFYLFLSALWGSLARFFCLPSFLLFFFLFPLPFPAQST